MQQHTGQHLLSALCADGYRWPTLSVHFGDDYCTVDVAASSVDVATLREIERIANARITDDRPVTVSFEDAAAATGLRKPSDRAGELRIVTIDGIDRSACGGTHVRRTGEIGSMLLRRAERMKGGTRIEFLCGMRSVARASADAELLSRAARALSAAPEELPALVESQLQRLTETERERKRLAGELARFEAQALWNGATPGADGMRRIRLDLRDKPVREGEPLARELTALGGCIVLAVGTSPWGIMLATAADTAVDAGALLKPALAAAGGRGGGSPRLAQGSVADADAAETVAAALGF
jgi:alanyl-tRNA synthetase